MIRLPSLRLKPRSRLASRINPRGLDAVVGTAREPSMPLITVDIQQTGPGRWVAEFEAGGVVARRRLLNAASFDEIILKVIEAHAALVPPEPPPRPVGPDRPIDESLLPPKPAVPLSKTAAQQMRVASAETALARWDEANTVREREEHEWAAAAAASLTLQLAPPEPVKPPRRPPSYGRQADYTKRMERVAARQARAAESEGRES